MTWLLYGLTCVEALVGVWFIARAWSPRPPKFDAPELSIPKEYITMSSEDRGLL